MIRKFLGGLAFGAGIAVAFAIVGWCVLSLWTHVSLGPPHLTASGGPAGTQVMDDSAPQFDKLSLDEKIKKASVITLARYEHSPDGKLKAVFKEFLKKAPDTDFYDTDQAQGSDLAKFGGVAEGDTLIAFYVGSPAAFAESISFTGEHLSMYGDMPLEMFRQKCKG